MMITMFENENLETVIPSFEDLSFEEMRALQGAGEVQAETTPACAKMVPIYAEAAQLTVIRRF